MVCPLRFVLAGLSAAIVLFLAVDMLWLSQKDDIYQGLDVRALFRQWHRRPCLVIVFVMPSHFWSRQALWFPLADAHV